MWNYGFAYGRSKPRLAGKRMLWPGWPPGTSSWTSCSRPARASSIWESPTTAASRIRPSACCPTRRSAVSAWTRTGSYSSTRPPSARNARPSTPIWSAGPTGSSRNSLPPKRFRPGSEPPRWYRSRPGRRSRCCR
ncbi:hypothetical protein KP696_06385 [Nocardia seriolae]|nr:hypothetical protein KEC46_20140 [Nocardia seriolae]